MIHTTQQQDSGTLASQLIDEAYSIGYERGAEDTRESGGGLLALAAGLVVGVVLGAAGAIIAFAVL